MNTFSQHIPSCVDATPDPPAPFTTTADLLALPRLVSWASDPTFSHFALSDRRILAVLRDGFEWWVVGRVATTEGVDLPTWDHGQYRVRLDGVEHTFPGTAVSWTCGDRVQLVDGRTARLVKRR